MGLVAADRAYANVTISAVESGGAVIFTFSGSVDLTSLLGPDPSPSASVFSSGDQVIVNLEQPASEVYFWPFVSSPLTDFTTNPSAYATAETFSASGFGLNKNGNIWVKAGYSSGDPISSTMSFNGTISSLGLLPGTYIWVLVNGQTVTLTIGPPSVTSVVPATGSLAGGDTITIYGNNFTAATAVTIGGNPCSTFTVVSATSITCTTPAHGAGMASVLVTRSGVTNTENTLYDYVLPPTVSSVSPLTGTTAGSTSITITGTGFLTEATVTVGGVACTSPSVSSTSITCTTGAHAAGAVDVVVTNNDSQSGTGINAFTYQSPDASGTTPGGTVNVVATGGTFVGSTAQFTTPTSPPSGQSFPFGVFGFTATTTSGGSITITLTYPQALAAGTKVWKDLNGTWLDWTNNVTISGNTITYTITDGGAGDADGLVNGRITDPLGPSISSAAVPSLSEWTQLMLALMVLSVIGWHFHREGSY